MLIFLLSNKLDENKALTRTFIRGLSENLTTKLFNIAICCLLYLVIKLSPVLIKELIRGKGSKYSFFPYCRFHYTITQSHDNKLSLQSHFYHQTLIKTSLARKYMQTYLMFDVHEIRGGAEGRGRWQGRLYYSIIFIK